MNLMRSWAYDGWGEHGFQPTWRSRFADWVLWKSNVATAIACCMFGINTPDDLRGRPLWQRPLYRGKAIVCLVLGWHYPGESYASDDVQIAWWNGAMTGYYEPEWEDDSVSVGEGWRDWWVVLNASNEKRG
jgi:hypothetical protein